MSQKIDDLFKIAQEWIQNNQLFVRGYVFMALGLLLVYLTMKIFLNVLVFTTGIILIYDAAKRLELKKISFVFESIFTLLGCNCSK